MTLAEEVQNYIAENYAFEFNTKELRQRAIYELQQIHFPDHRYEFVDRTTIDMVNEGGDIF